MKKDLIKKEYQKKIDSFNYHSKKYYNENTSEISDTKFDQLKKEILHQDIQSIFDMETELFPCLVSMKFLGQHWRFLY